MMMGGSYQEFVGVDHGPVAMLLKLKNHQNWIVQKMWLIIINHTRLAGVLHWMLVELLG